MKKFIKLVVFLLLLCIALYRPFGSIVVEKNLPKNYDNAKVIPVTKPSKIAENTSETPPRKTILLVNKAHPLSSAYVPEDLVLPHIGFIQSAAPEEKLLQREAAKALEELFAFGRKKNIILYGVSAYRSYASQKEVYEERIRTVGQVQADLYVAHPGTSEHQSGLAIDVTNLKGVQGELTVDFGSTQEGIWLKKNAQNFGFILRYPPGKEQITGYNYESWHIRYVGIEAAKEITEKGLVLEEYLDSK